MSKGITIEIINAGIFVREEKNRFLCTVLVDGSEQRCYVPSSSRLSNYITLNGKRVLLTPIKTKAASMKLALVATRWRRSYIILNSSLVNALIENCITGRRFFYLEKRRNIMREVMVEQYKADLYIEDSKTIIEIKTVLSMDESALYPTVYSERSIEQLHLLKKQLLNGYRVCYIIVSLNPYTKEIVVSNDSKWTRIVQECIDLGMMLKTYCCRLYANNTLRIHKEIPIKFT